MHPARVFIVVSAAVVLLGSHLATAQRTFTITDLGTLGGAVSVAFGVNDLGQVVGESWIPSEAAHAFRWDNGTMIDLGTLGGDHDRSIAFDINNAGQIVGYSYAGDRANSSIPFLWQHGVLTALPLLDGHTWGVAMAINNLGHVVGSSEGQAVLWINGAVIPLDTNGGTRSSAEGINDHGHIVGSITRPEAGAHSQAVVWENGVMRNLPRPALPDCPDGSCVFSSAAMAINAHGVVAGFANDLDEKNHAVRWENGRGTSLGVLDGARDSAALRGSINDRGEIFGVSDSFATLWIDGQPQALPGGNFAMAISNNQHIVGASGSRAVMWTLNEVDDSAPRVAVAAQRGKIWPPNGKLVPVTFTGTVSDNVSTIGSVSFAVRDEYRRVQPAGTAAVTNGRFKIVVKLEASRRGTDKNGRQYMLTVTAADAAGNHASASTSAIVPRDQR